MKSIHVALLGFGAVGKGTYDVLQKSYDKIYRDLGLDISIKKILVKDKDKPRNIENSESIITTNIDDIINDDDIHIVAELTGDKELGAKFMLRAIKSNKHVVTANKSSLANNLTTLLSAARKNGVSFKYEASVCGAIPIISSISSPLAHNNFVEGYGIVNGTANYILTKMAKDKISYDQALLQAQKLGFAESCPDDDVLGIDSANKLSILIYLMFGEYIRPEHIDTTGITGVSLEDIKAAEIRGKKIKLIASARKSNDIITASVSPSEISDTNPLYKTDYEYNAVLLKDESFDELFFYGKGAGSLPTGNAVLGDIVTIAMSL